MFKAASTTLLSYVGWSFLPSYISRYLLTLIYRYVWPLMHQTAPPTPQSPNYLRHYRNTFACVVLCYLGYNLYTSAQNMAWNFYQVLGVPSSVDESGLKFAFRSFAKKNHPDRPGVGPAGAELFMQVRDIYEALKDPVVRFAYDRFGPEVLDWRSVCSTRSEYLRRGLFQSCGFHIVSGFMLVVYSITGKPNPIAFWRYIIFVTLFASELALLVGPSSTGFTWDTTAASNNGSLISIITPFPQRVVFQHVLFFHQLSLMLSIALTQVGPILFPGILQDAMPSKEELQKLGEAMYALSSVADREVSIMLHTELHAMHPAVKNDAESSRFIRPFVPSPDSVPLRTLTNEIESMIIETNVKRETGPLRSVWEGAISRGRRAAGLRPSYYGSSTSINSPARPATLRRKTTARSGSGGKTLKTTPVIKSNGPSWVNGREIVDVDALDDELIASGSDCEDKSIGSVVRRKWSNHGTTLPSSPLQKPSKKSDQRGRSASC